jgi:hypothetical protein
MCARNALLNSNGESFVEMCKTNSKGMWVREYGHMCLLGCDAM